MKTNRINYRQPKYILPAILYLPLLFTGYFVIDMLHTEKAETTDPSMQRTEYLNPELPKPRVKELGSKMESMKSSFGTIEDFSAVDIIDREGDGLSLEEYESKYSDDERDALAGNGQQGRQTGPDNDTGTGTGTTTTKPNDSDARNAAMEEQLRKSAARAAALQRQDGDYPFPLTESERLIQSQQREAALREELEQVLAQLREQSAAQVTGTAKPAASTATSEERTRAVSTPGEDDPAMVVKRIRQSSDYFHTVSENEPQPDLIKAILDEDLKAVDGSRVRLRLLDDIQIGSLYMPRGSYIYAIMNGFSSQRVKGTVKSILLHDEIIKVNLSIYDTDGLEGLYVPQSSFRETARDVASGAVGSTMSINQGGYNNSLSQWGMQAVQNAYQRTTSAVGKVIRKNSAHLKYGTFVYLVNGNQSRQE